MCACLKESVGKRVHAIDCKRGSERSYGGVLFESLSLTKTMAGSMVVRLVLILAALSVAFCVDDKCAACNAVAVRMNLSLSLSRSLTHGLYVFLYLLPFSRSPKDSDPNAFD